MQDCQIQILRIVKKEWLSWQTFFLEYTTSAHVCFIHQWFKKQNANKIEIFLPSAQEIQTVLLVQS